MENNIHKVDSEEIYRMYIAELSRTSAVLASYCVKCTNPKIIMTNICENCYHRMIMHKHMEDYRNELLKPPPQIILTDAAEQGQPIVCTIPQSFYDNFFKDYMEQDTCLVLDTENAKRYFKQ